MTRQEAELLAAIGQRLTEIEEHQRTQRGVLSQIVKLLTVLGDDERGRLREREHDALRKRPRSQRLSVVRE
jgi:hypothetical protein